mgnify:FL=1
MAGKMLLGIGLPYLSQVVMSQREALANHAALPKDIDASQAAAATTPTTETRPAKPSRKLRIILQRACMLSEMLHPAQLNGAKDEKSAALHVGPADCGWCTHWLRLDRYTAGIGAGMDGAPAE